MHIDKPGLRPHPGIYHSARARVETSRPDGQRHSRPQQQQQTTKTMTTTTTTRTGLSTSLSSHTSSRAVPRPPPSIPPPSPPSSMHPASSRSARVSCTSPSKCAFFRGRQNKRRRKSAETQRDVFHQRWCRRVMVAHAQPTQVATKKRSATYDHRHKKEIRGKYSKVWGR